ncbi:DUF445 domain-containing protein [Listeria swaminathanii]|uniref:DUF445 domain-containing protein n=1 Tax=Listeria swaminathanii TaxID=2713501 RepID=A0ABU2IFW9_9LIST|nr:DUF445 domain-containing protein [Listeria swaminathanii]MDT0018085.1 DUF445 domain-containing protein [Listeria swaminathanii]MDT0022480.1 DUF445 domain-containing protein [Listeria swaminathanii]MDT0033444.1 DUF445 domain-containing protein [Listeria swaminathanii]MDT0052604.1 DUF445 domain-containing protein [Listeria swaminathanii]MDT0055369.1 DUF445 domain-containing protein [Listeria swaminathanii]
MSVLFTILLMAVIGGFIGAMTNYIAIRMLFRPYKAVYLFNKRLPFTPGLIPKRRDELAEHIGKVVVSHLLTEDAIRARLLDENLQKEITDTVTKMFHEKMQLETTPNELLHHLGYENAEVRSVAWLETTIEKEINRFLTTKKTTQMSDLIPAMLETELATKLPHVTDRITSKMSIFIASEEGKTQIKQMLQKFFEEHGKMGSMARMFINVDSFSEKIQQEGLKLIGQEDTKNLINQLLTTEWQNFEAKELQALIPVEKQAHLAKQLTSELIQAVPHDKIFNQPIQVMLSNYETSITEKVIPFAVERMLDFVASHSAEIVGRMDLAKLVETQIATFSLPEIEKLVVEISGRELKMITYLGGILGGFIGIIQGILAMWI